MVPKLDLIAYQPSFLDLFIEWRIQPLSVRHSPLKAMSREEIKAMLESEGCILSDLAKNESYRWFIRCEDAIVGSVSLKNISHTMGYAEIGYGVAEHRQGTGIATAAVNMLVKKCFCESSLRKLLAYVHDKNIASCRVLEKAGFAQEGTLREHYLINGVPENEILFGLPRKPVLPAKKVSSIPETLDMLIMKLLSQSASARYAPRRIHVSRYGRSNRG